MLELLRRQLRELLDQRAAAEARIDEVVTAAETEGRSLSDTETATFNEVRGQIRILDETRSTLEGQIAEFETRERDRTAAEARAAALPTTSVEARTPAPAGGARVVAEARTYSRDAERRQGVSFLSDVAAAHGFAYVQGAQERLARHMNEERVDGRLGADEARGIEERAAGTGAFAGLTVPAYLTDMVAPRVAAMRPLANVMNGMPLPAVGMTVNISRVTTGTSVAVVAENTAVSETNIDDTLLSINVQQAAGQQTLSIAALQRAIGTEAVTVGDLVKRYHSALDTQIINQATVGLDAVAGVSVTYTDASPTAAELYPKLFDLIQQVQTAVYMGVTHFVMHPRRWAWLASQVGTSFPFLTVSGAGVQQGGAYAGTQTYDQGVGNSGKVAGTIAGVPVILDANIAVNLGVGTNEDRIYGICADEAYLWEDASAPLLIRAEQPPAASLGVLFVVYGFFAYTFERYASSAGKISGTGLVTPAF